MVRTSESVSGAQCQKYVEFQDGLRHARRIWRFVSWDFDIPQLNQQLSMCIPQSRLILDGIKLESNYIRVQ